MTTKTFEETTRLAYQWITEIDYAGLEYDPDKPEALPDAMQQDPILRDFMYVLADYCTESDRSPDNFISTNTILCYDRNDLNVRVQPDCYLAFGVDVQAIRQRKMYLPWEVGKPPDLALEVGSGSTSNNDIIGKRLIYARIGIPEYWLFDPTGESLYGQPLSGELLVNGVYRPMELTTEPDGVLKGYSPLLGIYLCWDEGLLLFYNPATGTYLRNLRRERALREAEQSAHEQTQAQLQTEQSAHEQTQAELQTEQSAHEQTQAQLQAERAARESTEARIRELEERLHQQQPED